MGAVLADDIDAGQDVGAEVAGVDPARTCARRQEWAARRWPLLPDTWSHPSECARCWGQERSAWAMACPVGIVSAFDLV